MLKSLHSLLNGKARKPQYDKEMPLKSIFKVLRSTGGGAEYVECGPISGVFYDNDGDWPVGYV